MVSYVLVPYTEEYAAVCDDWRADLITRANEVAGRSDSFRQSTLVQVAGRDGWYDEGDPGTRYRPVIHRALAVYFQDPGNS